MAHVQRAGGVGADELHLHLLPATDIQGAIGLVLGQNLTHHRRPGFRFDEKINKPRTGNFDPLQEVLRILNLRHQGLSDLTGGQILQFGG